MTSPKATLEKTCNRLEEVIARIKKAQETCTQRFTDNPEDFAATADLSALAEELELALEANSF